VVVDEDVLGLFRADPVSCCAGGEVHDVGLDTVFLAEVVVELFGCGAHPAKIVLVCKFNRADGGPIETTLGRTGEWRRETRTLPVRY
jgi:hypothetical protein